MVTAVEEEVQGEQGVSGGTEADSPKSERGEATGIRADQKEGGGEAQQSEQVPMIEEGESEAVSVQQGNNSEAGQEGARRSGDPGSSDSLPRGARKSGESSSSYVMVEEAAPDFEDIPSPRCSQGVRSVWDEQGIVL